jgi:hypothetical protein
MIVIRLNSGSARNLLNWIGGKVEHPADMLAESATRVERSLRGHFSERDKRGNKLGGRRTNFWAAIANSTAIGDVTDRQADVNIGDPRFAQKLHGGTITAKTPWPGSGFLLLTIPVHPAAHGRRVSVAARETGLKMTFVGSAAGGVIGHFARQAAEDEVYYACVPSVTQTADPEALPPGETLEQEAQKGAEDYLQTEVQAAQTGESTP